MTKQLSFVSLYDGDGGGSMTDLLRRFGMLHRNETNFDNVDVVVFNGGADIGTDIYHELPVEVGIPKYPSRRDDNEMGIFDLIGAKKEILKVGICRGAQLLNCLNGGTLWQDVSDHGRDHSMTVVETGEELRITSTHHQMMRTGPGAVVIGTSHEARYKRAQGKIIQGFDPDEDMEIVYYPKTNTLCIQGHPEYVPGSSFAQFCIDLILKYTKETVH